MRVFNKIMDFIEWIFIENNTLGLKIVMAWITLGLVFALIEFWTRTI